MSTHLEAALQQDLEQIRSKVTEMGDLAEKAIRASIKAVVEKDRQLAFAVILRDQYIDDLEKQLDRLCLEFLVRHQPAASLLRFAYAAIKINLELERVGDYAESIARESLRLTKLDAPLPIDLIQQIVNLAIPMLHDAIQAFVHQDPELARRTVESDEAVDLLRDKLTADLTQAYRDGKLPFEALNPLVVLARRLERVSDQARNISMETLYMCTGEYAKHPGSEVMRVLFVDEHNTCRSLMAEAIGMGMHEPGFVFASAGVEPLPVDPVTISFMASKGFDVARAVPKAITQVPNIDHQDVIVLLASEVKRAFPRRPRKAVLLEWAVDDPRTVHGSEPQITAAYEATYAYIQGQIHDLVSAIRDASRL
ncbi:MAG: phosphate transport system regulatory protein PhoU [Acidobacteria bacterium RBG_13_68_16]|nr:MAG: phosphate transport system regulatory protein PhoU [Acidobacteria bacterium RBG_13_68_16]